MEEKKWKQKKTVARKRRTVVPKGEKTLKMVIAVRHGDYEVFDESLSQKGISQDREKHEVPKNLNLARNKSP